MHEMDMMATTKDRRHTLCWGYSN